jgi:hypothetical protein
MLSPNTARKRTCSEDAGSAFASKRPAFVDDNHDDRIGPTTSSTSTSVGTQWSIEDYQLKSRVPIDFIESFTAHLYRSHSALFRRWRMASLLTARLGLEMATSLSARGYINDRTRVVSLLRRCPQITTLNLGMLQETTADEQRRFVAALGVHGPFPQVTSLVLPHYLSALEWNALVTACPNVTTVDLEHTIGTTQTRVMKGLVDELVRFGHLRHLRLPVQCNTVVALPALTTLESLGNVQVRYCLCVLIVPNAPGYRRSHHAASRSRCDACARRCAGYSSTRWWSARWRRVLWSTCSTRCRASRRSSFAK